MKTILYVFVFLLIGAKFISCTPQSANEIEASECCGNDGGIPPVKVSK